MNLCDPELELIDPTPNVHSLFMHFDQVFFWTKLGSRAVVRWSKRMYSCAGICSYQRGGLCDIALSEPLLKLRPRKDLIETLLHEMIHAYLFVTSRVQERDGHGPNFKEHMYRINKAAGLNITIYHDFHEEVKLYQTHWWRCNGPCQTMKPYFGIVRRTMNKAPGPTDYWWKGHQMKCGGNFIKIKEPENYGKGKNKQAKPNGDITKYINTSDNNHKEKVTKPVLKVSNNVPVKSNLVTKSNNSSTIVVTKRNNVVYNPQVTKSPVIFSGKGQTINSASMTKREDVVDTVRNIWANKQLTPSTTANNNIKTEVETNSVSAIAASTNKHKAVTHSPSPPSKRKKIDDYFIRTATSLLKDVYGKEFEIKETNKRLSVVSIITNTVDCPVCKNKISSEEINRHLDECLNKEVIETIIKPENNNFNDNNEQEFTKINKEHDKVLLSNIKTEINSYFTNCETKNCIKSEKIVKEDEPKIKIEPGTSKSTDAVITINEQKCPCCGDITSKSIDEHLDECLAFFDNNTTMPTEGASTSLVNDTILLEDEDNFDESLTLNETGTKYPCPCCLILVEQDEMNNHLDYCLS